MMGASRIFPACLALLLASCGEPARSTAALRQWACVWQREWTPAVGAEIAWKNGKPQVLRPPVD